jgi:hypothetical protein
MNVIAPEIKSSGKDRWRQIEPDQRYYENDGSRKEGCKASGPGNEAGIKEGETAPFSPEEVCPTTTVNYLNP